MRPKVRGPSPFLWGLQALCYPVRYHAEVRPRTFNQRVVGSIPTALTKKIKCLAEKRRRRGDFGEAWGKPYSSPCLRLSRRETPSLRSVKPLSCGKSPSTTPS